ncbi:peptide chain release factor N(5)-glutamine methyltransferase [Nocardioides sp. 616]|uniref:peptide chain release factor N(5)-glutamine methyltransferase n=1 Tax=Nocardioides sp. 616 TaxID=2268090 RepID=UPI000CE515BE|nr:peptide chain release factor N(5)-glutamine methyltransferase [Nocardioides sp. 616]
MSHARAARRIAAQRLREAGVASPDRDADELLAHVLGVSLGGLVQVEEVSPSDSRAYDALVARRATREPLQHILGSAAFRYLELEVGPGVFVPRPETELLAGWAVEAAIEVERATGRGAVVVDLCTGSGAIAASVAHEAPSAQVHAVELDEAAHGWALRNLTGTGVDLRQGDMATAFPELAGTVDVVVCNPPYIPLEAWESVAAEARDHDPHLALFSGDDGLDAIRVLEERAALLLRRGGVVGAEHADAQGESAPAVFATSGRWAEVRDHADLAGRARFLTARLAR